MYCCDNYIIRRETEECWAISYQKRDRWCFT
uniref:NHL repeat-containing protein 2 n=1 Tax=Rhizophora mucronata TaxID=61149 RepID=A0A2P2MLM8_RHIMU